jgi:SDR family mycofactocin-dependent oxidoreductase
VGLLTGKVAYVTGAARGQGRAHAVRLAGEGADIVAIDICGQATPVGYPVANPDDLAETVRLVEALDRRIIAHEADVRDHRALAAAAKEASETFGRLDIVVANAGVSTWGRCWEMTAEHWQDMIDINLTGVWNTMRATIPLMIEHGNGGSIVLTSSVAGIKSLPGQAHYSAAKHGVVGLCKSAAIELGEYGIRVNTLHPWGVDTLMAQDPVVGEMLEKYPGYMSSFGSILQPGMSPPEDMADAVLYLVSDLSKSVTGTQLTVDNGATKV